MQKTNLTNAVLSRIGSRPAFSKGRLIVCAALLVAILISVGIYRNAALDVAGTSYSASTEQHQIRIGRQMLRVPENLIRYRRDRRSGERQQLELYMLWPNLTGFTHNERASFNDGTNIVFVSIASAATQPSVERTQNAYLSITYPVATTPSGLELRRFQQDGGFTDEVLVVGARSPSRPFFSRCFTQEMAETLLAPCERRLPLTEDIILIYRFPRDLLPEWQQLDDKMLKRLTELLQDR